MSVILTLDVTDNCQAEAILRKCAGHFSHVKIGHIALSSLGLEAVQKMCQDLPLFLDLKFHDIPNTIAKAITGYGERFPNLKFFTIHGTAHDDVLKAAQDNSGNAMPLAVLTLSSDDINLDATKRIAERNIKAGINSFICPPYFIKAMRESFGEDIILATPGVRNTPAKDDHNEIISSKQAYANGANYVIVGRPILNAPDPKQAILEYSK